MLIKFAKTDAGHRIKPKDAEHLEVEIPLIKGLTPGQSIDVFRQELAEAGAMHWTIIGSPVFSKTYLNLLEYEENTIV